MCWKVVVVEHMPLPLQSREEFEHFYLQLSLIASTTARLRAAVETGNAQTIEDAQEAQTAVAQAMTVLQEFYAKAGEATALLQQQPVAPEIFDTPYNVIKSGDWNKVPLLGGYNKNDGSMFVPAVPIVLRNTTLPLDTYKDLLAVAEHVYSNNATAAKLVADYYFSLKPNYTQEIGSVLLRDFVLHCYSGNSFQEAARQGVPVYTYYLDAKEPLWPLYWVLKDHHGMEMQFVWDNPTWVGSLIMPGTPRNQKIGTQVSEFFTNFAKYANPNGEGDSSGHKHTWPLYDVDTEPSLRIDKDFQAIYKQDTQQCEFWKSMLPYWVNM